MLKCKICSATLVSVEDHVKHQDLLHRVNAKTPIPCGYEQCSCKVSNLLKYHDHVKKFHFSSNDVSYESPQTQEVISEDSTDETLLLKCAHHGCSYKSRSQSTLRSHHFWEHRGKNSLASPVSPASQAQPSPAQAPRTEEAGSSSSGSAALGDENLRNHHEDISDSEQTLSAPFPQGICVSLGGDSQTELSKKKIVHLGMTLTSKYHVPDSSLHYVLNTYKTLLHENALIQAEQLRSELLALGHNDSAVTEPIVERVVSDSVLNNLHGPNGPMRSYYMRQQSYGKHFPYLPAKQLYLGLNQVNEPCKCHYVPIEDSIQSLFQDDSVYEQYLESQNRKSVLADDLADFHDGTVFKDHPLFSTDPSALQLILFQDDIEIANGIGPAAGTFKLAHISYTLGNLFPWNRSKVDPIQLLLLCKEKDVSYFGYPKVLEPIMQTLKNLEVNGINIRGKTVKVGVLALLGDNLGTHTFCGFSEGFATGAYFCRYCEESRAEWKKRWNMGNGSQEQDQNESSSDSSDSSDASDSSDEDLNEETVSEEENDVEDTVSDEDDVPLADLIPLCDLTRQLNKRKAPLRTVDSYNKCVQELAEKPEGVKGVVGSCILNELKYFHVVGGTPPCLPHDIYEGVIPYDMLLCIRKLMKTYKFSYEYLNRTIKSFSFKGGDKLDKPPAKFHAQRKKVKGSAIQNWTFLRFLPLFLDKKVTNKSDPVWTLILTLIKLVCLLASPIISETVLPHVDSLIFKYLSLRTTLFNVPLRCKHKYLEHYVFLTKRYGPLSKSSTLRFEAKHSFFRSELRAKKNMKSVTKTISKAHQLMQASLKIGHLFDLRPVVLDALVFDELRVDENVLKCIQATFGKAAASSLLYSTRMTFRNVEYSEGNIIVTSTANYPRIECIKIKTLMSDGVVGYALGLKCLGILIEDLQVFKLEESALHTSIQLDTLKDYTAYPVYSHRQQPTLVLKHLYLRK